MSDQDSSLRSAGAAPDVDRRERCARCCRRHGLAWSVPDDVWRAVMDTLQYVVCLDCFDGEATWRGVAYLPALTIHGYVSRRDREADA